VGLISALFECSCPFQSPRFNLFLPAVRWSVLSSWKSSIRHRWYREHGWYSCSCCCSCCCSD